MTDMSTRYLGFELSSPLVASASPLTGNLDALRRLEDAGAGAVVLPSLFEEQITHDEIAVDRLLSADSECFVEALHYFPELDDYNTGPHRYLELIRRAKAILSIPVIASLNGVSDGWWLHHAERLEDAGADAIELNVYSVAADPAVSGHEVEEGVLDVIQDLRGGVSIPIAVKVGPFFSSMAHMARQMVRAGADGLVLFNRFYQPDVDLHTIRVVPTLDLSTSPELRLPLRWIAILRGRIGASLAATTGIHTSEDAAKVLLAGADVAMMTSALLRHGPEHLGSVLNALRAWMSDRGYDSVEEMKGSLSQLASPDPAAFERANYMRALVAYSTRVLG
jgi:dihydroorotate dehydrogenase (fumarate)